MDTKVNYAVVGFFVIVLGAAGISISLWLSLGEFQKRYEPYYAYMTESVSGLYRDAAVKYRGVDVGKVGEIILDPDNPEQVRLRLDIEHGTPIKEDTRAVLAMQGLTGIAFIDLQGGSLKSPKLEVKPGQEYPVIESDPSFLVRLDTAVSSLITNLNRLADDTHTLLNDENQKNFANLLANIEQLTTTLAAERNNLSVALNRASALFENSAEASAKIPQLIDQIGRSAQAVENMAQRFTRTGTGLQQTVEAAGRDVQRFTGETLPEAAALVMELRELTGGLQRITRQLEQDPSVLLYGRAQRPGPGEK